MATKTVKTETTPRGLQLAAVIALGGSFAVQWALTFSTVLQQLQYNANLSSYAGFFIGSVVVPVLFFAGAFFLNPRKLSRLGRWYESMVIMLIGQVAVQLAVQLTMVLRLALPSFGDAYLDFVLYDLVATGITTVAYFAVLLALRRTKRWK